MVYLALMFIDASGHASSDPTDVVKFRMVRTLEFAMKTTTRGTLWFQDFGWFDNMKTIYLPTKAMSDAQDEEQEENDKEEND